MEAHLNVCHGYSECSGHAGVGEIRLVAEPEHHPVRRRQGAERSLNVYSTQNGILSKLSLGVRNVLRRQLVGHAAAGEQPVRLVAGDLLKPGPRSPRITTRLPVSPGTQRRLLGDVLSIAVRNAEASCLGIAMAADRVPVPISQSIDV